MCLALFVANGNAAIDSSIDSSQFKQTADSHWLIARNFEIGFLDCHLPFTALCSLKDPHFMWSIVAWKTGKDR